MMQLIVTVASLLFAVSGTYVAERALDRYARIPEAAQQDSTQPAAAEAEAEPGPEG